jgi:hypothetical protein
MGVIDSDSTKNSNEYGIFMHIYTHNMHNTYIYTHILYTYEI